jgi:hypothetical protein
MGEQRFHFPIQRYFPECNYGLQLHSIPWEMIASHEKQAMENHCGQTLERLAQRGGLSACEAVAVLDDRPYKRMDADSAIMALRHLHHQWLEARA